MGFAARCLSLARLQEIFNLHSIRHFGENRVAQPWRPCYNVAAMPPPSEKPDIHSEAFLHRLMRRQLKLSIVCAGAFLAALLGLPLANYFLPEVMAMRVFGFTLTWLILGVLFFPLVWGIAWAFIRRSIALEEHEISELSETSHEGKRVSQ